MFTIGMGLSELDLYIFFTFRLLIAYRQHFDLFS